MGFFSNLAQKDLSIVGPDLKHKDHSQWGPKIFPILLDIAYVSGLEKNEAKLLSKVSIDMRGTQSKMSTAYTVISCRHYGHKHKYCSWSTTTDRFRPRFLTS